MANDISQAGLQFITSLEGGARLTAYQDVKGIWTVGVGHTGPYVVKGTTITLQQAMTMLDNDTHKVVAALNEFLAIAGGKYLGRPPNQNEFNALVSFGFNCGVRAMGKLMNHNWSNIPEQMLLWVHADGKVVEGLVNRRKAERALFLTPEEDDNSAPASASAVVPIQTS